MTEAFAVVFPGQGSQRPGMLSDIAAAHPVVRECFAEAADITGTDYWDLSQHSDAEALADTRITQPLMFIADIAVWRALRAAGLPDPGVLAGHSLGELAALVAAEALGFADGVRLVRRRAELMAAAVPEGEGGMAALLGLDDDAVIALCQAHSGERVVEAVNFNAPGQVAISGHRDAIEALLPAAREAGAKRAMALPVSVPNHSSLMREAAAAFAEEIDALSWQNSRWPIVQNLDATANRECDALLQRLRDHVHQPVQWTASVQKLVTEHGITRIIEAGPGKVLAGLIRRIDRSIDCVAVDDADSFNAALAATT